MVVTLENNTFYHCNNVYNINFYRTNSVNRNFQGNGDNKKHTNNFNRIIFCNICKKWGHLKIASVGNSRFWGNFNCY